MHAHGYGFVDLYWLPLGTGGHSARLNGRIFEAIASRIEGRDARDSTTRPSRFASRKDASSSSKHPLETGTAQPVAPSSKGLLEHGRPAGSGSSATRFGAGPTASFPTRQKPSRALGV